MGWGLVDLSLTAFLKDNRFLVLRRCMSNLFYSEIVYRKNKYLKIHQHLNFSVSKRKFMYSLAWDVPFIAPVMTRAYIEYFH